VRISVRSGRRRKDSFSGKRALICLFGFYSRGKGLQTGQWNSKADKTYAVEPLLALDQKLAS
jgi:hypothetical protein